MLQSLHEKGHHQSWHIFSVQDSLLAKLHKVKQVNQQLPHVQEMYMKTFGKVPSSAVSSEQSEEVLNKKDVIEEDLNVESTQNTIQTN